jgi:hypothetical protein
VKKEETNNNSFFFPSHSLMKKVMLQKGLSIKSYSFSFSYFYKKAHTAQHKLSTLKRKISSFKMEVQQLQELSAPSSASSFPSNSIPTIIDESKSVVADETKEEFKIEKEKDVSNI